jgi:hypothetical protein
MNWYPALKYLHVLLVIVAAAFYTPNLKQRIEAVEAVEGDGWQSPAYQSATRRGTPVGILLAAMALLIVLDMVVKPHF